MIERKAYDFALSVDPKMGASIHELRWRDHEIFRTGDAKTLTGSSCFPLIPYSNRLKNGVRNKDGHFLSLSATRTPDLSDHPIHGLGWLSYWKPIDRQGPNSVTLEHNVPTAHGHWPWTYTSKLHFLLSETSLRIDLEVTNTDIRTMPVGLGFHPYFSVDADTLLHALHRGECQNDAQNIPLQIETSSNAKDWWHGAALTSRTVDTAYVHRQGDMKLLWPQRGYGVIMRTCKRLQHTVIYTPKDKNFACIEPVTHITNAMNSDLGASDIIWIKPAQSCKVHLEILPFEI